MKARIGYFIPEFPGQTHIFFWREREALAELGIETALVSTRRPPKAIASHSWAEQAQKNTAYLAPLTIKDFVGSLIEFIKAGPNAWFHCFAVIAKAKDMSLSQKLGLCGMILFASKLAWLARTQGWNHVHVHSCANAANIAMFASILSGITYSLTHLGPTLETYGPNQEQKWKYASFAIVESDKLLKRVQEKLTDLPKQIAVAPMGVNLTEIKRNRSYSPWQTDESCRIFSCGRLNPVKGHKYLVETVELLQQQGFNVQLQIAGEDEQGGTGYHKELEQLIRDKSLSDHIELLGAVSEERIRQGLEEAHVFALASLNEGTSIAIMEAMAMGSPVIVTDVGGTAELVDDGINAILVQPQNPEEMAHAIVKVLQDKELALSFSRESRQKITAKYHHRISAEKIALCLKNLHTDATQSRFTLATE